MLYVGFLLCIEKKIPYLVQFSGLLFKSHSRDSASRAFVKGAECTSALQPEEVCHHSCVAEEHLRTQQADISHSSSDTVGYCNGQVGVIEMPTPGLGRRPPSWGTALFSSGC